MIKKGKLYVIIAYLLFNVYYLVDYFFLRLGRFGSSATDVLAAGGASPNAGGALPNSSAGAVSTCTVTFTGAAGVVTGAAGCAHVCSVV